MGRSFSSRTDHDDGNEVRGDRLAELQGSPDPDLEWSFVTDHMRRNGPSSSADYLLPYLPTCSPAWNSSG
ncbi:MAG TPA: hypothetical protein PKJ15_07070, partial [Methanomassiliicoccales archaeon]|nr:hypothetical protein [Methanomassiliicoccales archaeon]